LHLLLLLLLGRGRLRDGSRRDGLHELFDEDVVNFALLLLNASVDKPVLQGESDGATAASAARALGLHRHAGLQLAWGKADKRCCVGGGMSGDWHLVDVLEVEDGSFRAGGAVD